MYNVALTLKSGNVKTGPIPVSTTSKSTCPSSCGMREACYAASGPLALHWRKVSEGTRGTNWDTFTATIAQLPDGALWRHNQAGDLPGDGAQIDAEALAQLVTANKGKRGFTYTHYDAQNNGVNHEAIAEANAQGFTVNLSGDNLAHADELKALNIGPVVTVVPMDATENLTTPKGHKVVLCPATQRDDVSCATCQLCQRQRSVIVGFPAHGTSKRKADAVARRVIAIASA